MVLAACYRRVAAALALILVPLSAGCIEFSTAQRLGMEQNANYNIEAKSAAVGDANGDGRTDVAFFVDGFGSQDPSMNFMAYVYEQQADGTMWLQSRFTLAPGGTPRYEVNTSEFADLDGDGLAEIVLDGQSSLGILKRSAAGAYSEVASIERPFRAAQLMVVDPNEDGIVDILVQGAHGYSIHLGLGNLAFARPTYVLAHGAATGTVADLDGDNVPDLIGSSRDFSINTGIGLPPGVVAGTQRELFREPLLLQPIVPDNPWRPAAGSITVGHFPGDAKPQAAMLYMDVVESNFIQYFYQTVAILGWSEDGRLPARAVYRLDDPISTDDPPIRAYDIDADGDDDLVIFRAGRPRILLQENGTFLPMYMPPNSPSTANANAALSAHIVDFNGDGCVDIGYPDRSYSIHYRLDCPTANAQQAKSLRALRTPVARPAARPVPPKKTKNRQHAR